MALHCFNLFFPCTNILQVKCMHRPRSLYCTFKVAAKFATISRLFSDQAEVCVRNIRGARGMWPGWRRRGRDCAVKCTWGLFPATLIGWNVGNVGRNAGIGPHSHTLTHTTTRGDGRGPQPNIASWCDVRSSGICLVPALFNSNFCIFPLLASA